MRNRIKITLPIFKHGNVQRVSTIKRLCKYIVIVHAGATTHYAGMEIAHCCGISITKTVRRIVRIRRHGIIAKLAVLVAQSKYLLFLLLRTRAHGIYLCRQLVNFRLRFQKKHAAGAEEKQAHSHHSDGHLRRAELLPDGGKAAVAGHAAVDKRTAARASVPRFRLFNRHLTGYPSNGRGYPLKEEGRKADKCRDNVDGNGNIKENRRRAKAARNGARKRDDCENRQGNDAY